jgi:hypothetical protein
MAPAALHYEQWIGPSPYHPYSPQYFGGSAGLNCLFWNMYRDFGVGQMGDMGAHTMDMAWNVIDAGAPTSIEVDQEVSDKYNPDICPVKLKVAFAHPANSWRGPIEVVWYQGGLKPETPRGYIDLDNVGNGAIFEGTKGTILADFTSRIILPNNDDGDFTYYKRRGKDQLLSLVDGGPGEVTQGLPKRPAGQGGKKPPLPSGFTAMPDATPGPNGFPAVQMLSNGLPADLGMENPNIKPLLDGSPIKPMIGDMFKAEWLDACKGKFKGATHGTSNKTHCDFDYAGTMMEQMLLGLVAHRAGKKLTYDPATGRVTNSSEANEWLKRTYRGGWTLNG